MQIEQPLHFCQIGLAASGATSHGGSILWAEHRCLTISWEPSIPVTVVVELATSTVLRSRSSSSSLTHFREWPVESKRRQDNLQGLRLFSGPNSEPFSTFSQIFANSQARICCLCDSRPSLVASNHSFQQDLKHRDWEKGALSYEFPRHCSKFPHFTRFLERQFEHDQGFNRGGIP